MVETKAFVSGIGNCAAGILNANESYLRGKINDFSSGTPNIIYSEKEVSRNSFIESGISIHSLRSISSNTIEVGGVVKPVKLFPFKCNDCETEFESLNYDEDDCRACGSNNIDEISITYED